MFNNKTQLSELLIIFGLFFLSNISAFISIIWLSPKFLLIEVLLWFLFVLFSVRVMVRRGLFPVFIEGLGRNWFLLPFAVFSGFSILWSIYWEVSLFRWVIFLSTIITGGYIGVRFSVREITRFLSVFGVYILLLSFALVLFKPDMGVMNYYSIQGAWKGVYWHKNHMGLIAAFANTLLLLSIINEFRSKKRLLLWVVPYLFSLFFIYQSDSVAAYFTTLALHGLVLAAFLFVTYRRRIRAVHYLTFFIPLALGLFILIANMGGVLGAFDRNTTLTGRVPMWNYVFDTYFSQRPLGGYGFNAFWYIDDHQVDVQRAANYPDPIIIADNGFIDILLNTGYVGFALFLLFYLGVSWHALRRALKADTMYDVFPMILMAYSLLANISWSLIFENEGFFTLIMIAVLFAINARPADKSE
jgi:exopolysaccharide production protein ExoQ